MIEMQGSEVVAVVKQTAAHDAQILLRRDRDGFANKKPYEVPSELNPSRLSGIRWRMKGIGVNKEKQEGLSRFRFGTLRKAQIGAEGELI